jgi:hypothetical protein
MNIFLKAFFKKKRIRFENQDEIENKQEENQSKISSFAI